MVTESGEQAHGEEKDQKYIKFTQRQVPRERGLNSVMQGSSSHIWNNGFEQCCSVDLSMMKEMFYIYNS